MRSSIIRSAVALMSLIAYVPCLCAQPLCYDYAPLDVVLSTTMVLNANDISISGTTAYVANDLLAVSVVDISDPRAITVTRNMYRQEPCTTILPSFLSIATEQGLVFSPYTNQLPPIGSCYIAVFDPALEDAFIGEVPVPATIADIVVEGRIAYVVDSQGLTIVDCADQDPDNWRIRGVLQIGTTAYQLAKVGQYVYVAAGQGGIQIVDCSNVDTPYVAGTISNGTGFEYYAIARSGNTLYLGNKGYFEVVDITNRLYPSFYPARIQLHNCILDLAVDGTSVYAAVQDAGIARVDCTTLNAPALRGLVPSPQARSVTASDGSVLPAEQNPFLRCLDGSLILNRDYLLGSAPTLAQASDIDVSGRYVYVANDEGAPNKLAGSCGAGEVPPEVYGMEVFDISDPAQPTRVAHVDLKDVVNDFVPVSVVRIAGSYAYLGTGFNGLAIYDIANPKMPEYRFWGNTAPESIAHTTDIAVTDTLLYFTTIYYCILVDIASPTSPVILSSIDGPCHGVRAEGSYAYIASGSQGLRVYDVSNPATPQLVGGWYDSQSDARRLCLSNGIVYLMDAVSHNRVAILDVSAPATPQLIRTIALPGSAAELTVAGRFAYVANANTGLTVIDIATPASAEIVGTVATENAAMGVCTDSDNLYVAESWNRMTVAKRQCGDWEPSKVRYENRSADTNMNYSGTPYSSIAIDYDANGRRDLMVSIKEDGARLFQQQADLSANRVPVFANATSLAFAQPPGAGIRGLAAADYDNDGYIDFFAAGGSNAALYHNTNGAFEDVTTGVFIAGLVSHSWAGAWGDYDRDGALDLFVCRGEPLSGQPETQEPTPSTLDASQGYLLRNDLFGETQQFVNVTSAAGIASVPAMVSITASWADIDGDKDLDLLVGEMREDKTARVFVNNDNGTFTEDASGRFPCDVDGASAVSWADVNNDGAPDLVVASQLRSPWVLVNTGDGKFLSGPPIALDVADHHTLGARPLDHDNDGRVDVLALPESSGDHPWLFGNKLIDSGMMFVDESSTVHLAGSAGRADGIVAADFNRDGDSDLYLGRPIVSGEYFFRAVADDGSDGLQGEWVGLRLKPSGANNRAGLGAKVLFTVGSTFQQLQIVDGGSGRGGQSDTTLVCGLGTRGGPVEAVITWPGGFVQTVYLERNRVNEVFDETVPAIVTGSATSSYLAKPGGLADWKFTWETQYSCKASLERVTISDVSGNPAQCEALGTIVLTPSTAGVKSMIAAKPGGGYIHTMEWQNRDCRAICNYNFTVESATERQSSAAQQRTIRIPVCIQ